MTVKQEVLEPLSLTVTEAARHLGVTPQALNKLVHGQVGVSPEMALRLAGAFGGDPEGWLARQAAYDIARIRAEKTLRVTPISGSGGD